MNPPRRGKPAAALVRLFRLGLRLYPADFRASYAEEMQAIFRLRLAEAAGRSRGAVPGLVFKEGLALLPGAVAAHVEARRGSNILAFFLVIFSYLSDGGSKMSIRRLFPNQSEQTPWSTALLSLAPFILVGPLAPLLAYHPWWDPGQLPWIKAVHLAAAISLLFLGFLVGALKQFPRWSYLYSLYVLFFLTYGIIFLVNRGPVRIDDDNVGYVLLLLIGLVFIASRYLPFMRLFFANIRQDWTLLSYALYAVVVMLTATNDTGESPVYNLQVQLPSLIAWLGALAYLRLVDPLKKVGALLGAMLLSVLTWWWPVFGGNTGLVGLLGMTGVLLVMWALLSALVLSPILVNGLARRRRATGGDFQK